MSKTTPDTIKALIEKAGKSFTGHSWTSGPDLVVAALKRKDTARAAEPDSGLDVPDDGSMYFGGLRQRWADLLRDCAASDGSDLNLLMEEAEDIRAENAAYVKSLANEARQIGTMALLSLEAGDVDEAVRLLEDACTCERTFGEAHSWEPALEAARAYAATLAEEESEAHETGDELTAARHIAAQDK